VCSAGFQRDRHAERRGTVAHSFAQRLARARILFLRRREQFGNWLALAIVLALAPSLNAPAAFAHDDTARDSARASPAGNSFREPENVRIALKSTPEASRSDHVR
jgi:hypothetical protein